MHVLTNLVLVYIMRTDCKIKLYRHQPSVSSSPTTQSRQTDVIASDTAAKEVHIVYVYIFKDRTEKLYYSFKYMYTSHMVPFTYIYSNTTHLLIFSSM
jgi:hypothetical protein